MRPTTRTLLHLALAVAVAGVALLVNAALEGLGSDTSREDEVAVRHFIVAAGAAAAIFGLAAMAALIRRHFEALHGAAGRVAMSVARNVTELPRPEQPVPPDLATLYSAAQALVTSRTEQKNDAEERLTAVLASVPQAIIVVTGTGLVSLVNGAAQAAFERDKLAIGTSVFDALSRDDYEAALVRAKATGGTLTDKLRTTADDILEMHVTALHGDTGAVLVFDPGDVRHPQGVAHDLTLHDAPPPAEPFSDETPLRDLPICVFDSETTGLDVTTDSIVSMGGVRMHGTRIFPEATVDVLVDPGRPIPESSTRVHGITDDMVAGAPVFAIAWPDVAELIRGTVLVGHNIGFDLAILRRAVSAAGLDWAPPPTLDTALLIAALDPREKDLTLDAIAARFGVAVRGRHTALGDVLVTAEVMHRLIPRLQASGVATLGEAKALARRPKRIVAAQQKAGWQAH